jgi:hypothetical protein
MAGPARRLSGTGPTPVRRPHDLRVVLIWLIANNIGGHEPLILNPVNPWMATLILAITLDLGGAHARTVSSTEHRR